MTDSVASLATVFNHLTKLFKSLVPEQVSELVAGTAKLVVLTPDQRVVDRSPGLDAALRLLDRLTPEQASQLADRKARIVLLPQGHKIVQPLDLAEVATELRQLSTAEDIVKALDADSRLTGTQLKLLARELNITIPPRAKVKGAIQLHIGQTLATYRARNPAAAYTNNGITP